MNDKQNVVYLNNIVVVYAIHWHESAMGVHVSAILNLFPPPSPSHPSGSSQCNSPEDSVSCIEPGPVIYFAYDNIHVSMLFSQIISPLPSSTESKSLFFTSVSPLLSHIQGHRFHLSKFHIYALLYCTGGEGNGTPLQYSCLENPMDGGAWWATVHGVAQSRTQLKRLSSSSSIKWPRPVLFILDANDSKCW